MSEVRGATQEIGEGLHAIFDRIGEFFHLFDLSFLVSGTTTFSAIAVLYIRIGGPNFFPFADWVGVFALIIGSYVCGLMSFAIGRAINTIFRRSVLESTLQAALDSHQLASPSLDVYRTAPSDGNWRLYIRLWQDAAQRGAGSLVLRHLMRYWAMAATFDGLGFSFLIWALVSFLTTTRIAHEPVNRSAGTAIGVVFLVLATIAFWQGAKYYKYQVEDIVAALAASKTEVA